MIRGRHALTSPHRGGFTLLELMVGVMIFSLVVAFLYSMYGRNQRAQANSLDMAEAQQNARVALGLIQREMRSAGYGLDNTQHAAIEVASAYRVTFVMDFNGNNTIDAGERITYFLDQNLSDPTAAATRNPRDRVLRRVASTVADPNAAPTSGAGTIVAYGMTQNAGTNGLPTTPLFTYLDQSGANLAGTTTDGTNSFYGVTVPDSMLGKPPSVGGKLSSVATVLVQVVTQTAKPVRETGAYHTFTLSARVTPRAAPYVSMLALATVPPPIGGGGDYDTLPPEDSLPPPTDTLPPYVPPIRIATDQVLSLALLDTNEQDSQEGSLVHTDGQRDLDIVVGTKTGSSNNLYVWWNGYPYGYTGSVLFQTAHSWTGLSGYDLYALTPGTYNTDGSNYPDLISGVKRITNQGAIQTWFNQGTLGHQGTLGVGVWPTATVPNASYYRFAAPVTGEVRAVAVGDVDADGDEDAVAACRTGSSTGTVEVWFNDGYGVYTHSTGDTYTASNNTYAVSLADMNGDGQLDIVAGCIKNTTTGYIDVWMNNPSSKGHFVSRTSYTVVGSVYALATGDMDADGDPDVIVGTKTGTKEGKVEFWRNSSGSLTFKDSAVTNGYVLCLAIGPLDYPNTDPDVVAGTASQTIEAWWVDPAGADGNILPDFSNWSDAVTGGQVNAVAIGKLEGPVTDPSQDLLNDVVAGVGISTTAGEIDIYLNPYVASIQQ